MDAGAGPSCSSSAATATRRATAPARGDVTRAPAAQGEGVLCVRLSHDCAAETCRNSACPFCKNAAVRPCPPPDPLRVRDVFPVNTPLKALCGRPVLATLCRQDVSGAAEPLPKDKLEEMAAAGGCFAVCSAAESPLDAAFHGDVDRYWDSLRCGGGGVTPIFPIVVLTDGAGVAEGAAEGAAEGVTRFPISVTGATELRGITFRGSSDVSAAVGPTERAVLLVRYAAGDGGVDRNVAGAASGPFRVVSENGMKTARRPALWLDDPVERVCHIARGAGTGKADILSQRGIETVEQLRDAVQHGGADAVAALQRAVNLNDKKWAEVREHVDAAMEFDERMVAYYANLEGPLCAPDSVPCEISSVLPHLVKRKGGKKLARKVGVAIAVAAAYERRGGVPALDAAAGFTVRVGAGQRDAAALEQLVPRPLQPSPAYQLLTGRLQAFARQAWREHGDLERACGWHFLVDGRGVAVAALGDIDGDAFETNATRRPVDAADRNV